MAAVALHTLRAISMNSDGPLERLLDWGKGLKREGRGGGKKLCSQKNESLSSQTERGHSLGTSSIEMDFVLLAGEQNPFGSLSPAHGEV